MPADLPEIISGHQKVASDPAIVVRPAVRRHQELKNTPNRLFKTLLVQRYRTCFLVESPNKGLQLR